MRLHRMRVMLVATAVTSTLGAGAALAATSGPDSKTWDDPWKGLSDPERQATVSAAHAAGRSWFEDFVASGRDPRSLPLFPIEAYAAPMDDLEQLGAAAQVIVVGTVEGQSFALAEGSVVPSSAAKLRVARVIAGDQGRVGTVETLVQTGGPLRTTADGRGALAQIEWEPLLLKGDVVIVAALVFEDGTLRALPGLGIHFTTNGTHVTGTGTPMLSELAGLTLDDAASRLADAAARSKAP